jgi:hypothetical protein
VRRGVDSFDEGPSHLIEKSRTSETSRPPPASYNDEPLGVIVYRMAEKGVTRLPMGARLRLPLIFGGRSNNAA